MNDAEYPVHLYQCSGVNKKLIWVCPYYQTWASMLVRCYSANTHRTRKNYIGCSVSSGWLKFSDFRSWMVLQDWHGKHLDKDILVSGNKIYSPETCVFVSGELNGFLGDCGASRGKWPIGVSWHKKTGKFVAQCQNPFTGKRGHIGLFESPEDAHQAWRAKKHEHACRYADMQEDHRIAEALRARYAVSPAHRLDE